MRFRPRLYAELKRDEAEDGQQRREAEQSGDDQRAGGERCRKHERALGRELAARDRPVALDGMRAVVRRVPQVVDQVRSARRRAVGNEDRRRLGPTRRVSELRREDDAGEQEQVLRPLPRAERRRRAARKAPRRGRSATTGAGSGRITSRSAEPARSVDPRPTSVSRSIRPPSACASSRAMARPRPVPPPSRDQNGRKIRSRSAAAIPGPCPRRSRRSCRCPASARARSGRRQASSRNAFDRRFVMIWSTRSPSVMSTGCACSSLR